MYSIPRQPAESSPLPDAQETQTPLDARRWADLAAMATTEPEFIVELVDVYAHDAPERLAQARKARDAGDTKALGCSVHVLKGSSATVGAEPLARLCRELEQVALRGDPAAMDAGLMAIGHELERVIHALRVMREHFAGLSDGNASGHAKRLR